MKKDLLYVDPKEYHRRQLEIRRKKNNKDFGNALEFLIKTLMRIFMTIANFVIFGFYCVIFYEIRNKITDQGSMIFLLFGVVLMFNCILYGYAYVESFEDKKKGVDKK